MTAYLIHWPGADASRAVALAFDTKMQADSVDLDPERSGIVVAAAGDFKKQGATGAQLVALFNRFKLNDALPVSKFENLETGAIRVFRLLPSAAGEKVKPSGDKPLAGSIDPRRKRRSKAEIAEDAKRSETREEKVLKRGARPAHEKALALIERADGADVAEVAGTLGVKEKVAGNVVSQLRILFPAKTIKLSTDEKTGRRAWRIAP
jgi:hypothetical protein